MNIDPGLWLCLTGCHSLQQVNDPPRGVQRLPEGEKSIPELSGQNNGVRGIYVATITTLRSYTRADRDIDWQVGKGDWSTRKLPSECRLCLMLMQSHRAAPVSLYPAIGHKRWHEGFLKLRTCLFTLAPPLRTRFCPATHQKEQTNVLP